MDILTIVLIIIALAAVGVAGAMAGKVRAAEALRKKAEQEKEVGEAAWAGRKAEFQTDCETRLKEMKEASDAQLMSQREMAEKRLNEQREEAEKRLNEQREEAEKRLNEQREEAEKRLNEQKEEAEKRLKEQKDFYEKNQAALEQRFDLQMEQQKLAFDKLSRDHLKAQQEDMKKTNVESLVNLLNPLKDSINDFQEKFRKGLEERGEKEAGMKAMIEELSKTATGLGKDAESLAKALRSESKTQGNWCAGVLSNILSNSGLRENIDYFVQKSESTEENGRLIADVVVKMRDGVLLIDSKTSLTAYTNYCNAENEGDKAAYLKAHLESVRKHVNELSAKNYTGTFEGSPDYILMFIPVEGSYVLAVDNDPDLITYAYGKKILICNPSTLLLTLRIVFLFWQSDRQAKNVSDMIKTITAIYDKFAGFTETFEDMGARILTVQKSYDKARAQLVSGRGNLVNQMKKLTAKGINPKKEISSALLDESDSDEGGE